MSDYLAAEYRARANGQALDFQGRPRLPDPPERAPTFAELPHQPTAGKLGFPLPIPASQLALDGGGKPDWILEGYLARGSVTLLTALWKIGKSTFLAHFLKALGTGEPLAGQRVKSARALVLSEESQGLWAARRDKLAIGDHALFLCRPFPLGKPSPLDWRMFVTDHLAGLVESERIDVVIVDTLLAFLPCKDENDAAQILAGLCPLHALTKTAAILLIHHPKKGDANEGQASRGSGALPGFVDVIVEMRRACASERTNRQRVLTAYSRYDSTPGELVIELTEDGSRYSALGCRADVDREQRI